MAITGYGHTFQDEKAKKAFAQMKKEARQRALARKKSMTPDEKERAEIRSHFSKEAKHFKI